MEAFDGSKKPLASMGRETRRRRPKDNIDLDMEAAERLGYGPHYGHYKADHPHTKDANEARLYPKKKQEKPARKVWEKVCPVCGKKFTTTAVVRVYCDDSCKEKHDSKKWNKIYADRKKEEKHD